MKIHSLQDYYICLSKLCDYLYGYDMSTYLENVRKMHLNIVSGAYLDIQGKGGHSTDIMCSFRIIEGKFQEQKGYPVLP